VSADKAEHVKQYGNRREFHLVLFTVDETAFSRELAPLAGFYSSVYVGAPWWFLGAPDSVQRFRASVTETAGFIAGRASSTIRALSSRFRRATTCRADSTPPISPASSERDAST